MSFDFVVRAIIFTGIFGPIFVLALTFWFLMNFGRKQRVIALSEQSNKYIKSAVLSILDMPCDPDLGKALTAFKQYLGKSAHNYNYLSQVLFDELADIDPENELRQQNFFKIIDAVDPVGFYSRLLKTGSAADKALACKMLSAYSAESEIKNIERCLNSKNSDLSYNAALALSRLGDEDSISKFIIDCKDNYKFSHRLVLQLIGEYNKDVKALAGLVFRECDDYVKASVIKSLAKYNFYDFENIYMESLKSGNPSLKVAAVMAIGNFADPKFERQLILSSNDRMWIVRNAAVKALGKLNTENALRAVGRATSDMEWWVRTSAAQTLIKMDGGLEMAEKILSKFDNYASDAIKNALYKSAERV